MRTSTLLKVLTSLAAICAAPWFLFWLLIKGVRVIVRLARIARRLRAAFSDSMRCVQGHENEALGYWRCACGASWSGYAFARCPLCNTTAGFIADGCTRCGLSIMNPMGGA